MDEVFKVTIIVTIFTALVLLACRAGNLAGQSQAVVLSNCNLCCFNKVMFPTLNSSILFVVFSALLQ